MTPCRGHLVANAGFHLIGMEDARYIARQDVEYLTSERKTL